MGFPGGSDGKESDCNEPRFNPWSGRSPGEGNGNPLPMFLPGKSYEWKSLAGFTPWGHRELDTTEQLTHIG